MITSWLGHSSVAFTERTYVHGQVELLSDLGRTWAQTRSGEDQ